jgi:hypothetical protein
MKPQQVFVVVFRQTGLPPQHYFVASDKDRIVFFKEMKLGSIPTTNLKEKNDSFILLSRNNQIICGLSCEWINEEYIGGIFFVSHGFDEIRERAQEYDITAHDLDILKADWFDESDFLEIHKDNWGQASWLSQITTCRAYGAKFTKVFPEKSPICKMLPEYLRNRYSELKNKTLIFDGQQPFLKELKEFY